MQNVVRDAMLTVYTNTVTFLFRFLLMPFLIWLNYVPISRMIGGYYARTDRSFVFYVGLPFFLIFLIACILSLLAVYKIEVDTQKNSIIIRKALKTFSISAQDIEGYYLSSFRNKWKEYEGIFLKLRNGKTIELSEYNLETLYDFNQYLVQQGIPDLGRKTSWFPISRRL